MILVHPELSRQQMKIAVSMQQVVVHLVTMYMQVCHEQRAQSCFSETQGLADVKVLFQAACEGDESFFYTSVVGYVEQHCKTHWFMCSWLFFQELHQSDGLYIFLKYTHSGGACEVDTCDNSVTSGMCKDSLDGQS